MNAQEILELINVAINTIQEKTGREVRPLTDRTRPIGDLPGFSSLNGLELSIMLSKDLPLGPDFNPCISDDGERALSMAEIVERISANISSKRR